MIRIVSDSTASLPASLSSDDVVKILSLYVNYHGKEYDDAVMDVDAFYGDIAAMIDDIPTSSQPSQQAFIDTFEQAACAGDEVLGVFISSGLSGTYENALAAARIVAASHASFRYAMIDSTSCGGDEAFPLMAAIESVRNGHSLEHAAQAALLSIQSTRFLFTPETLTYLQRGGRIGSVAALLGNLVQIAPVLTVQDCHPIPLEKVRTRKKACKRIVEIMQQDCEAHGGLKRIVVHYIGDRKPADEWAHAVIEPLVGHAVDVVPVSPVIGVHVGPAIGLVYECMRPIKDKITGSVQQYLCTS